MSNVVIGIDPSSKKLAAIITIDDGKPKRWTGLLPQQDISARCALAYKLARHMVRALVEEIGPGHDIYVFIEDPVVGRGGARPTIVQSKVHGAVVAACINTGLVKSVKTVNNSQWKKRIVGKGNADKLMIKRWCRQYWRDASLLSKGDQDLIDSAGINRYGHRVVGVMERLEVHRQTTAPVSRPRTKMRRK